MLKERFLAIGEYAGAGLYEEPHRSLFYRKSLGLRRFATPWRRSSPRTRMAPPPFCAVWHPLIFPTFWACPF